MICCMHDSDSGDMRQVFRCRNGPPASNPGSAVPAQKRYSATDNSVLFEEQFDCFDPGRYEPVQYRMMGFVSALRKLVVDDEHDATGTLVKNARYHKHRGCLHLRAHSSTGNPGPATSVQLLGQWLAVRLDLAVERVFRLRHTQVKRKTQFFGCGSKCQRDVDVGDCRKFDGHILPSRPFVADRSCNDCQISNADSRLHCA